MRNSKSIFAFCLLPAASCLLAALALAGQVSSHDARIREAALRVERAAATLDEAAATTRLAGLFRVTPRTVTDLRDQKLDFGEVAVVLAMAKAGRTSPDAVLGLWASGRLNWAEIAERLRVDRRELLRQIDAARRELRRRSR